jgi:hypothetical protein
MFPGRLPSRRARFSPRASAPPTRAPSRISSAFSSTFSRIASSPSSTSSGADIGVLRLQLVEGVGAEDHALGHRLRRVAGGDAVRDELGVVQDGGEPRHPELLRLLGRRAGGAAQPLQVQRVLLADPDHQHALGREGAGGGVEQQRLPLLTLEVAPRDHPRDLPVQPLVHLGDRADQLVLALEDLDHQERGLELGAVGLDDSDFHGSPGLPQPGGRRRRRAPAPSRSPANGPGLGGVPPGPGATSSRLPSPDGAGVPPRRPAYRLSIGSTLSPRGPTYSALGRISRLLAYCSKRCAVQPVTREIAKIGVKRSISIPSVV